jgi:hypothetical protein
VDFKAGQTFLYPISASPHLWIIATDPNVDGRFVIVNFTSLRGSKDQTVSIRSGEHPFVTHNTCVNYRAAEITSIEILESRLLSGEAVMREPVTAGLLRLIFDGFNASEFTKDRVRRFISGIPRVTG